MRLLHQALLVAVLLPVALPSASGLMVLGSDSAHNQVSPSNGAPWDYVARLGGGQGSGVYLGNGYVITANHVNTVAPVFLHGVNYALDPTYGSSGQQQIGAADLKLLKLLGDPGLPPLPLIGDADEDLGAFSTIIGWGEGKGAVVPNQGWRWGGDTTTLERWGQNFTNATPKIVNDGTGHPQFVLLSTSFDLNAGPDEAQIAVFDSGCGLFVFTNGRWVLAGIGADVDTQGMALYDRDLATPGLQPDRSYFHRVKEYRTEIFALTGLTDLPAVPEPPSAALLFSFGALFACGRRRRERRCPPR